MATGFSLFYLLAHWLNWFPRYRIQGNPALDVPLLKVIGLRRLPIRLLVGGRMS